MNDDLKDNFNFWIKHCLKFSKFDKQYNKILSCLTPNNLEKYNHFEAFDDEYSCGGKEQWQHFDMAENPEKNLMFLSIKKGAIYYQVRVINTNINLIKANNLETAENDIKLDEDSYILLGVENSKKNTRYFLGVSIVKIKKEISLVLKEMNLIENKWEIQTETLTLSKEETKGLSV